MHSVCLLVLFRLNTMVQLLTFSISRLLIGFRGLASLCAVRMVFSQERTRSKRKNCVVLKLKCPLSAFQIQARGFGELHMY